MPIVVPAQGLPAGGLVEIEFEPDVWTDVTADLDSDPFTIKVGRSSEFSAPQVGTLTGLRLNNATGRYTPLCQVLADGTANPHYPNVLPRKRIRYSNTPAGTRFVGGIKGWPPFVDQNGRAWVMITSTDRLDPLSRITLKSPIAQELSSSGPVLLWPMTDVAGSTGALENAGGPALTITGSGSAPVFGDNGPGVGDGTGLKLTPTADAAGQFLLGTVALTLAAYTVEFWVHATPLPAWGIFQNILGFNSTPEDFGSTFSLNTGVPQFVDDGAGSVMSSGPSIADGSWHHIAVTRAATGDPITLYVDGVSVGTSAASSTTTAVTLVTVGENPSSNDGAVPSRFKGNVGYLGIYTSALTPAQIASHASATSGYHGDTTDERIARWLTAAGLTSADWDLDAGQVVVGTYPQAGKDVVAASQDMATTEGAGAAFYVNPPGAVRFANRLFRKPAAPVMTIDAEGDIDGSNYEPSFDEATLINQCTGNRAGESGTLSSQTFTDLVSLDAYGLTTDGSGITSYATTDTDVLGLAQSRVAGNANPGFRLGQVKIDMVTAQNSLYLALAELAIGSRIREINLPPALCPTTQLDLLVEGWSEVIGPETYDVILDTSPADNPARGVYDDTEYGRYQCSGQTLNANITNSATTLAIATAGSLPTFTTAAARYPLNIMIEREIITLTAAPSGSTSPQTFTGVTRAMAGTPAAAQAAGAVVNLWPAATYTL